MATVALGMYVVFLTGAFAGRVWLQYRRTKDHGVRVHPGQAGFIERIAMLFLLLGGIFAGAAPLAELFGLVAQSRSPAGAGLAGLVLVVSGFIGTIVAQLQMGDSWRIGVDQHETAPLVTVGLFGHVRNPIFSALLLAAVGLLLMVPNVLSAMALASTFLGIEIQVRRVEEPYLTRVHENRYLLYARRVGRFFPRIGCLS